MRTWTATWCASFLLCFTSSAAANGNEDPEVLLREAKHEELVNGDLAAAIGLYQGILDRHQDKRPLAAQALFRIGQCHERLGQSEARQAYTRLVREFPDQGALAGAAEKRLKELGVDAGDLTTERLVWDSPDPVGAACISPDGRHLPFVDWSALSVGIRDMVTGKNQLVVDGTRQGFSDGPPVISPDAKRVVFNWYQEGWEEYRLRISGVDGSDVADLYRSDEVRWVRPFDWSTDGKFILALSSRKDHTEQIAVISTKDGSARHIKSLDWSSSSNMKFSPDGRSFVYDRNVQSSPNGPPNHDIFVLDFEQNREIHLVQHPANDKLLGWAPDGETIVFSSNRRGSLDVWAVDASEAGQPTFVKKGLGDVTPIGFAADGSFYYSTLARPRDVYVATVDRDSGKMIVPPRKVSRIREGGNTSPDWSPDGRQLAYIRFRGQPSITILTLETEEYRELYTDLNYIYGKGARWAPDSKSFILAGTKKNGRRGIYQVDAESGQTQLIRRVDGDRAGQPEWTPDGKSIVFSEGRTSYSVRMLNLETGNETELLAEVDSSREPSFALSPDGQSLAFVTHDQQASNLKILSLNGGEVQLLHQERPRVLGRVDWTPTGTHVLFEKIGKGRNTEFCQVSAKGGAVRSLGLSAKGVNPWLYPRIHPDGRQIAFTASNRAEHEPWSEVWVMENFLRPHPAHDAADGE